MAPLRSQKNQFTEILAGQEKRENPSVIAKSESEKLMEIERFFLTWDKIQPTPKEVSTFSKAQCLSRFWGKAKGGLILEDILIWYNPRKTLMKLVF